MSRGTMRVARLHGIRDLRIEEVPVPSPGPGELLVEVLANGICATDTRKYEIGVNDGDYPFNPGHEWVATVAEAGRGVEGWSQGDRLYGDTYGGYAELTTIPVEPGPWSCGPTRLPSDLPLERAVFVEPLADCLHAVHDQAGVTAGDQVAVIGAGPMGLQVIAAAARAGAEVAAVEPLADRQERARVMGASAVFDAEDWVREIRRWSGDDEGVRAVFLMLGAATLVAPSLEVCRPGARVVLFAGFGDRSEATLDLNVLHYREIAVVGSEWIGTPPNQRRDRYRDALELLASGEFRLEELVTDRCGFDELPAAIAERDSHRSLKTVFFPRGVA
jgi:L-iditol 2-dehydrogenase